MPYQTPISSIHPHMQTFTANLAQSAGTYTLCTAQGDCVVTVAAPYVVQSATGLISVAMQTNNITPDIILVTLTLLGITAGKNLALYNGGFFLPDGKSIQYTILGTGTAGILKVGTIFTGGVLV